MKLSECQEGDVIRYEWTTKGSRGFITYKTRDSSTGHVRVHVAWDDRELGHSTCHLGPHNDPEVVVLGRGKMMQNIVMDDPQTKSEVRP